MGVKLIKILFLTFISLTFALDSLNTYPKLPLKIAVIPGMGQIYNEQYLKAGALVSLEVYSAYKVLEFHDLGQISNRNTYVWWLAGLYFLGIVDAYVESHLRTFPKEKKKREDN